MPGWWGAAAEVAATLPLPMRCLRDADPVSLPVAAAAARVDGHGAGRVPGRLTTCSARNRSAIRMRPKAFAVFLQKYPQDELAPNAQYWLGESHYVAAQRRGAAGVRGGGQPLSRQYQAPGALFKIGRLQQAAGNNDAARASYEKVLRDYPDSPAAGLARQRLEQSGR